MSTRFALFTASILAASIFAGCKTQYDDVYSFKKNNFVPPPVKRTEVTPPPDANPIAPGGTAPGTPAPDAGIPGITPPPPPAPPTGIPGLDPAPAPAPGTPPATPPGT